MKSRACGQLGFGTECKVYRIRIEMAPRTFLQSITEKGDFKECNEGFFEIDEPNEKENRRWRRRFKSSGSDDSETDHYDFLTALMQ